jgi:hypothetical protein
MATEHDAPLDGPSDAPLERLLHDSRKLDEAPEQLIQRAIGLWQPRPLARPAEPAPMQALRHLVAALTFDSGTASAAALGLRSGALPTRQLLFSAEGHDVDLRLEPLVGGLWKVSGQVLGPDTAGSAELRPAGADIQQVAWGQLAEFSFEPVASGACRLVLRAGDWEIDIPDIPLRP